MNPVSTQTPTIARPAASRPGTNPPQGQLFSSNWTPPLQHTPASATPHAGGLHGMLRNFIAGLDDLCLIGFRRLQEKWRARPAADWQDGLAENAADAVLQEALPALSHLV